MNVGFRYLYRSLDRINC
nr:hypothetical protein [Lactiplantibacillus plantarum]